ncbi:MAG: SDR family NAD(P)-dependent oxidoreductase [Acidobacteria bacterium]|nr:SDR family NAD(P)-dependent oxidoreductase [Acidobacteriota bacterium]
MRPTSSASLPAASFPIAQRVADWLDRTETNAMNSSAIAVVGMAGRFPGASNIAQFWENLREGVESVRDLSDAELQTAGVSPDELNSPGYVKRAPILDGVPMFDASFFGFSPRDASIMDPQHRHFLECAWEALEDAGHPPKTFDGSVGAFAGSGMNSYLIHNLLANRKLLGSAGLFQLKQTGNDKDVLATRVSYQFDLRGPSINVQTACSTSLVAIHLACQSLLNHECDMALAGGVTIEIPHGHGYMYREGEILSRDGHCRAFDASSSGTVFGSGVGIVVLRRLEDALADDDNIRAVILGSAINNDGARKVGYLAPSVEGQMEAIAEALDFSGVSANEISYVETHGTGTTVGDPIEIRALTQAYRRSTASTGFCGIGSLKTNIGHLDAAAGVAGLIKTILALQHAQIPPSLHFQTPNPHLEIERSPFYINSRLTNWPSKGTPRRAGVTSLGIGGTNAHVVLEEAASRTIARNRKPFELLVVSAKTEAAADQALVNLATHLQQHPEVDRADAAFTCQLGRQEFQHRRSLVVEDSCDSCVSLSEKSRKQAAKGVANKPAPPVAFLFSGQGSQYVNMGRELYIHEPLFRETLDHCARELERHIGINLTTVMYPPDDEKEVASARLNETWLTQPALFAIEYSLARWWMSLGVQPAAMLGHSIGEYVTACLAGVFSLEDALGVVAFRGRLIFGLHAGSMLAVPLPAAKVPLTGSVSLAAVNSPDLCVISGTTEEVAAIEEQLAKESVACKRLFTSHAFHSSMMEPILGEFDEKLRSVTLNAPRIPYLSNVTGTWIRAEEATSPTYWTQHIRQTVLFSDGVSELLGNPNQVLLEVGPGSTLTSLARQQGASTRALQSTPHPREDDSDLRCALGSLGRLWTLGIEVKWNGLRLPHSAQRIPLPTYPFEHQKFWIEPDRIQEGTGHVSEAPASAPDNHDGWFYRRGWSPVSLPVKPADEVDRWVIFCDALGLGDTAAGQLLLAQKKVILVDPGSSFRESKKNRYTVRPDSREDYASLFSALSGMGFVPQRILHFWSVATRRNEESFGETLKESFYGPLCLAQTLGGLDLTDVKIGFVSNCLQQINREPIQDPVRAVLVGPAIIIPVELPGIACRAIDVDLEGDRVEACAEKVIAEMQALRDCSVVAWRGRERFEETLLPINLSVAPERRRLKTGGAYLITGGLGGLGLSVAEHLAREFKARLILVGRSDFADQKQWQDLLNDRTQTDKEKRRIRKLIEIESIAGGLLVANADVTDAGQMLEVIARSRKSFGHIDGVFHAAGVLDDGPLMLKTAQSATRVLDPKIRGTLVLEEVLRDEPLDCFVLFSSISSIIPFAGQVDYAAANAFLDSFAQARGPAVTVINWSAWREVGMAAHAKSQEPLLDERLANSPEKVIFASQFSVGKHTLLSDHRLKGGKALVVGTAYLEMAAEAFAGGSFHGPLDFRDVYFLAPLAFEGRETKELRVQLEASHGAGQEKGEFTFSILARGDSWVEHSTGFIAPCLTPPAEHLDREAILARCGKTTLEFDRQHRTRQEQYFDFGPRWLALKSLHIGENEGLAELELDEQFSHEISAYRMHPAVLDMATGCSLYLTKGYENSDDLYLPFSYSRLLLYRSIPLKSFGHIRARQENSAGAEMESFDITLFDGMGQAIADIEGFAMRRIPNPATVSDEGPAANDSKHISRARPIEIDESEGILPSEGVRALVRILSADTPNRIVVAPHPLAKAKAHNAVTQVKLAVSADPKHSVEETISGWFQDLLGIDNVEPDDDFFTLGGHSLIAVRLFAKIKTTFQVDLELATLFEARTVRALATLVRTKLQRAEPVKKKWSCLVPIQPNGSRLPMFFVHAIGGEVLFYEPLARCLGSDQPFYALQSSQTNFDESRGTSIEEMASLYLEEIRSFLPEGPYILGGHSYGGLIAFEMAQQLQAQGSEPALLIMLDAVVPGSKQHLKASTQLSTIRESLRSEGLGYLARKAGLKRVYWQRKMLMKVRHTRAYGYRLAGLQLPQGLRYSEMEETRVRALERYRFKSYNGKIVLIRATERGYGGVESISERDDATLGWGALAQGGVAVHNISAEHSNLLQEPFVRKVADEITAIASTQKSIFVKHS